MEKCVGSPSAPERTLSAVQESVHNDLVNTSNVDANLFDSYTINSMQSNSLDKAVIPNYLNVDSCSHESNVILDHSDNIKKDDIIEEKLDKGSSNSSENKTDAKDIIPSSKQKTSDSTIVAENAQHLSAICCSLEVPRELPSDDDNNNNQSRPFLKRTNSDEENSEELTSKKARYDDEEELSDDDFQDDIELNESDFCFGLNHEKDQKSQVYSSLEFDVLDEVNEANGDISNNELSDSDISEDEIDALLDEGLTRPRQKKENDELAHEERKKVLLKIRGHNHFDVLPEGWIEVTHNSGMPVYLHKQSRVCTMSKPYFLGSGSARKHEVPISAIPCLHYKKELEKEERENEKNKNSIDTDNQDNSSGAPVSGGPPLPPAKVESVRENQKEHSVDFMAVREYCQKLFDFQTITVRRFRTWAGRRKHQKIMKEQQRPSLPDGTKLITCPLPPVPEKAKAGNGNVNIKREFIMNPSGKSFVCILHEYVQHAMRMQPKYIFKELENASTPYGAIVVINKMEYGSGYGSSKKQAKSEAARATLEILIPQLKEVSNDGKASQEQQQDVAFFDEVRIVDPRVNELCAKAGQPSPYQILLECLKRNYGMGDTQIQFKMQNLKHQKNMFTMTVGKHEASVMCKNKRDGKQRASQAILQALHPHITSWGSLLRLYGKGSCKTLKEKKEEEQRITELQSKACANKPNFSILNKLKEEMVKLKLRRDAVKPIGKFIPQEMELPSTSASNLKNVEL